MGSCSSDSGQKAVQTIDSLKLLYYILRSGSVCEVLGNLYCSFQREGGLLSLHFQKTARTQNNIAIRYSVYVVV